MPLPDDATLVWPPKEVGEANALYVRWAAWWSGDTDALARAYQNSLGYEGDSVVDSRERRGLMSLLPRMFHGAPPAKGALRSSKLHIPLAADIATTSADLLFGEAPALVDPATAQTRPGSTADDNNRDEPATKRRPSPRPRPDGPVKAKATPTQRALDELMEQGLQQVLLEAAEICSAFGGVYLRVGWDPEIAEHPLFDAIPPDSAVPEFRSGRLVAVTFHRVLPAAKDDGKTYRHLERHEKGRILHGLYVSGDDKTLGRRTSLKEHPETEAFARLVNAAGFVETGASSLTAEYVPNMRPNRRHRGSQLGRSDYDGIEPVMDGLDEAWTSWMRDLRIGKGRLLVPEVYLDGQGRGEGALFDSEQEVFQLVNALPGAADGLAITNVQFAIRVQEHSDTCAALTEQAVRGAGYSAQTFGMNGDAAVTATEIAARERRTFQTRNKKIGYFKPAVRRLSKVGLEIWIKQFKPDAVEPVLPDVEFPDGIATDPQSLAQTLQLLRGAQAASTRTLVEMLHPDWDDKRIDDEVKAIDAEGKPDEPPAFPGTAAAGQVPGQGPAAGQQPVKVDPAVGKPAGQVPRPAGPAQSPAASRPAVNGRAVAGAGRRG